MREEMKILNGEREKTQEEMVALDGELELLMRHTRGETSWSEYQQELKAYRKHQEEKLRQMGMLAE